MSNLESDCSEYFRYLGFARLEL